MEALPGRIGLALTAAKTASQSPTRRSSSTPLSDMWQAEEDIEDMAWLNMSLLEDKENQDPVGMMGDNDREGAKKIRDPAMASTSAILPRLGLVSPKTNTKSISRGEMSSLSSSAALVLSLLGAVPSVGEGKEEVRVEVEEVDNDGTEEELESEVEEEETTVLLSNPFYMSSSSEEDEEEQMQTVKDKEIVKFKESLLLPPVSTPAVSPPISTTTPNVKRERKALRPLTTPSGPPPAKKMSKQHIPAPILPDNPLGLSARDNSGKLLTPQDDGFRQAFARKGLRTDPTNKIYLREFERFKGFVAESEGEETLQALLSSTLSTGQVSALVGDFMANRYNITEYRKSGVKTFLDTTSAALCWQKLVAVLRETTKYILSDRDFDVARQMKNSYLREAKKVPGLGELAHQAKPLSKAQISFLLHSDCMNIYTPKGLQCRFYIMLTLFFLPRVRSEASQVQRGEFRILLNPDGTDRCVVYAPNGSLKRDTGVRAGEKSGLTFKRPAAFPCVEPSLNFCLILREMFWHLDQLPHEGSRETQYMFHRCVASTPEPGHAFFLSDKLGLDSFDRLLRVALWSSGMDLKGQDVCNQVLRTTAFNMHQLIGVTADDSMSFSGHVSGRTRIIYQRNNAEFMAGIGAKIQEMVGGVEVDQPNFELVSMRHGPPRVMKSFLPYLDSDKEEFVSVLPIGRINRSELVEIFDRQ